MSDLKEFHPFRRLPLELRRKIWLWTLPRPRLLHCCMAKPIPSAVFINAEARSIALEHFEFVPKHRRFNTNRDCFDLPHRCNWGWIDFSVDYIARSCRLQAHCMISTPLKFKTQNLHMSSLYNVEWEWEEHPMKFKAGHWACSRLLGRYTPSVRRILIIVHRETIQKLPISKQAGVEDRSQALRVVMEKGLADLKTKEMERFQQKDRWKDWTPPEIQFQRCPCSWEEGSMPEECRRELDICL